MPVTLAEAKAHLRVTSGTEDDTITALIATATQYVPAALAQVMKGEPVGTPVTRPYGCSVKY